MKVTEHISPQHLRIWQWITVGKLTVKELSYKTFSIKKQVLGSSSLANLTIVSALKSYLEGKELFYTCMHIHSHAYTQKFPQHTSNLICIL